MARSYVQRSVGLAGVAAVGVLIGRWAARLSAALLRGNAAMHGRAGYPPRPLSGRSLLRLAP